MNTTLTSEVEQDVVHIFFVENQLKREVLHSRNAAVTFLIFFVISVVFLVVYFCSSEVETLIHPVYWIIWVVVGCSGLSVLVSSVSFYVYRRQAKSIQKLNNSTTVLYNQNY
ncbi:Hypothetical_protein [Hexamita inflata]|uniref:Hypothetical_protein n=1 Tax=Hexamita inflata TaxID=28002 RepID=A0AA86TSW6_9EUKA|nr:Hypothetical protein HINF_LOCUS8793 [Hexamita inflata]